MRKAAIYLGLRFAREANSFVSARDTKKKLRFQSSANSDRLAITVSLRADTEPMAQLKSFV
jgi:hypothetical protein